MQEGRRMFQIFAARMFEHRVLTAYKEKVAAERQQRLLEELQDEEKLEAQREAKKKRDAEKKKDKKKQQQAAKAEEKAKKEAEKTAEEARIREAEEKKQEEQRRKKEEQRKKKEDEKRKQDEDRMKKEAEKLRRQQEEQQRREDVERKAREVKAAEKSRKDDAKRREREEREARERTAKDRKAQEEKEKRDREVNARAQREPAKERERPAAPRTAHEPQLQSQAPQMKKRPSQIGMVAVPGVFPKQQAPSGLSSPHAAVAMPAIPKAPTPARQKTNSQQGSHASSPKQAQSQTASAASKPSSPRNNIAPQPQSHQSMPKTILQKLGPSQQATTQHASHLMPATASPIPPQQMQAPPGMSHPQHHPPSGFGGIPPMGFQGFQNPPGSMMQGGMRSPMPMFAPAHAGAPMGMQTRMSSFGAPGMNGMPGPSAGMMASQGRGIGFPFDAAGPNPNAPPGFGPQFPLQQSSQSSPIGPPLGNPIHNTEASRQPLPTHSRQQSGSEKERLEAAAALPISRPAPIQRPSSVKPQDDNTEMEDLSKHLGSSALLDDDSDDVPLSRQVSNAPNAARNGPLGSLGGFGGAAGAFGAPGGSWTAPSPFGQTTGLGQQWGNMPPASAMSGWMSNSAGFAANGGFGSIGGGAGALHRPGVLHGSNRPLTIRIAVCQACRQLSGAGRGDGQDYHDVHALVRQMEHNRAPLEAPPTLREIEDICETEGDPQNGGGELQVRKAGGATGDVVAVRWSPDGGAPELGGRGGALGGLGEIGSPMPSKSTPAAGFGAPGTGRAGAGAGGVPGGWMSLGAGF